MNADSWDRRSASICNSCTVCMYRATSAVFSGLVNHSAFCVVKAFTRGSAPRTFSLSPLTTLTGPHVTGEPLN